MSQSTYCEWQNPKNYHRNIWHEILKTSFMINILEIKISATQHEMHNNCYASRHENKELCWNMPTRQSYRFKKKPITWKGNTEDVVHERMLLAFHLQTDFQGHGGYYMKGFMTRTKWFKTISFSLLGPWDKVWKHTSCLNSWCIYMLDGWWIPHKLINFWELKIEVFPNV